MNLPVTIVPKCIVSNAKPLGLKLLYFPDMGANSEPADDVRVVNYGTDELLNLLATLSLVKQKYTILMEKLVVPLGEDPARPVSLPLSFSHDRYEWTSSAIHRGSYEVNGRFRYSGLTPRRAWLGEVSGSI